MKIKILFAKSYTLGGVFIRTALFSDHNHVGVQVDDVVYDSTFKNGVAVSSIDEFYSDWRVTDELWISVPDGEGLLKFLQDQLGKKYDWKAVVSLPFRRNWHSPKRWMCSELAAEALISGGVALPILSNRITPRDLMFVVPTCARVIEKRSI